MTSRQEREESREHADDFPPNLPRNNLYKNRFATTIIEKGSKDGFQETSQQTCISEVNFIKSWILAFLAIFSNQWFYTKPI